MGREGVLGVLVAAVVLAGCGHDGARESDRGVPTGWGVTAKRIGPAPVRDTLPFDESEIVSPKLRYGSFHVAADSARSIVTRSLAAWADSAVWNRESIEFDYRDTIEVLESGDAHPMWVLGSRPSRVNGLRMSLGLVSDGFEGERQVLGGLRAAGWVEDGQYGADGPDGSTLALVSDEAICFYSAHWDGGDDSDSTYVPAPGVSIELQVVPRFPVRRGPLVTSR